MPLTADQLRALRSTPLGSIPNKVRLARTLCDLKQTDVAAVTGFTSPQLSDIERGEYKDVPLENARALARFFDCDIEDLFPTRAADAPSSDAIERRGDRRSGEDRRAGDERRSTSDEVTR